jgi:hypothetical protein
MPKNIFSNQELNLKANVTRHFPMPFPFSISDTIFSLIQSQHYQIKLGDQIVIQVGDGKGKVISKLFYLIPSLPLVIAFPISETETTSFIGVSFTSTIDIDFAFSAANQYPPEYVNQFRN